MNWIFGLLVGWTFLGWMTFLIVAMTQEWPSSPIEWGCWFLIACLCGIISTVMFLFFTIAMSTAVLFIKILDFVT